MKCKRWICLLLSLCWMLTGFGAAQGKELQGLTELLNGYMSDQTVDGFEVIVDPASDLIYVNAAIDGTAQMVESGGSEAVLGLIKTASAQIHDEILALVKTEMGVDLTERLYYQLVSDDWMLRGDTSGRALLLSRFNGEWAADWSNESAKLSEIPTLYQEPGKTPEAPERGSVRYVLNLNTQKFHKLGCNSVKQMKDKNKKYFYGSREDAIAAGFVPCGNCTP